MQYVDIKDSYVKFVDAGRDPEKKFEDLNNETAELWFENMTLEAKVAEETSALWFEIMTGGVV